LSRLSASFALDLGRRDLVIHRTCGRRGSMTPGFSAQPDVVLKMSGISAYETEGTG
jgi:hypothetical protein